MRSVIRICFTGAREEQQSNHAVRRGAQQPHAHAPGAYPNNSLWNSNTLSEFEPAEAARAEASTVAQSESPPHTNTPMRFLRS